MFDLANTSDCQAETGEADLYRGEIPEAVDFGDSADIVAQKVADGLTVGSRATIEACAHLYSAVCHWEKDPAAIKTLLDALHQKKLVTAHDKRLGRSSSKLSMLTKIGQYSNDLRHADVLPHLHEGYSYIYQVALLLEAHKGQVSEVAKFFNERSAHGHVTRADIIAEKKEVEGSPIGNGDGCAPSHIGGIQTIVATPSRRDISRLSQDYMKEGSPWCLTLQEQVSEDAVMVVRSDVRNLPVTVNKLIRLNGFSNISQILMLEPAPGADIADMEVFVVAGRGTLKAASLKESDLASVSRGDPGSISELLFPGATKKVHLFAEDDISGWQCINGEANWNRGEVQ